MSTIFGIFIWLLLCLGAKEFTQLTTGALEQNGQKQGRAVQERHLRQVPQPLRAGVQQHLLADAAHVERHFPAVRRLLRRAQPQPHWPRRAHLGHARPHRAKGQNLLPVLVRRPQRTGDHRGLF